MPRAIADSDDEEDDLNVALGDQNDHSKPALPQGSQHTDGEVTLNELDGTNEQSTGSTERLRRQIQSAERGLMTNSAPVAGAAQPSSGSPSMQANKRRHTSAFGSQLSSSPEKKAKRTKTLKTYGAKRSTHVTDDGSFQALRRDEAAAPITSQSIRFSDHSAGELPSGSIQADFADHEPAIMFRDTGSTIADSSSAQRRLVEQALSSKKGMSTSAVLAIESNGPNSSSIPWSGLEGVRSTGGHDDHEADPVGNEIAVSRDETILPGNVEMQQEPAAPSRFTQKKIENQVSQQPQTSPPLEPQPSPVVKITPEEQHEAARTQAAPASTQKTTRGRKRKSEQNDNTELLNSDDRAIGLPKEQYVPRPSRRRATQVVEEPIDFSVRPEKAAKIKRTKTTQAGAGFTANQPSKSTSATIAAAGAVTQASEPTPKGLKASKLPIQDESRDETDHDQSANINSDDVDMSSQKSATPSTQPPKPSPSAEQTNQDKIFVKPAKPTPKAKSTARAKRSHTTIYEDHVEYTGSQQSPNLSQQQAKRKSALQDVKNEAKPATQKRRRTVVEDDDDEDVDEPAKESNNEPAEQEVAEPQKRGRGRPKKSTAKPAEKPQAKSAEIVLEDSEDGGNDQPEAREAPAKRGRGRSAGATKASQAKVTPEDGADATSKNPDLGKDSSKASEEATRSAGDDETPKKTSQSAKEMPTPSPDKPKEKVAATPSKGAKVSPTSHSPIKSSSKVPLRVGLSKRHRIPPLLRTMNPPKR